MKNKVKIYTPEEFGAKADGVTNDVLAFWKVFEAAKEGGIVKLQPNKTYFLGHTGQPDCKEAALHIANTKDLTLLGDNTTILLGRAMFYGSFRGNENLTVEGITFDHKVRPFVKAKMLEMDLEEHSAIIKTDRSLHIDKEVAAGDFAVLERPDQRYHLFTKTVAPIDAENFIYKVYFSVNGNLDRFMKMLEKDPLIFPIPGFAHRVERAFSVIGNKNFTMRNCKIHSIARFGFAMFHNEGVVRFENFRAEKAPDETANIVSWRDLFHVKESRAKYIWNNCYAEYCYDDIYNISASTLFVQEVISDTELDLGWQETGGIYSGARVGDTVSFMDFDTGRDMGSAKITEIVLREGSHNRFKFDRPIKGIFASRNMKAHVEDLVAPGSEINHCDYRGTFRFRGPIEIKDSHFYVARMWIDLEMPVEGPVPKHVHFRNCDFVCDDDKDIYFHVRAQKKEAIGEPQYHLEDILFENCALPRATFEIPESDRPFVVFK